MKPITNYVTIDPIKSSFEELEKLRCERIKSQQIRVLERLQLVDSLEYARSKAILQSKKEYNMNLAYNFMKQNVSKRLIRRMLYFARIALCNYYSILKANVHFIKKSFFRLSSFSRRKYRMNFYHYHFIRQSFRRLRRNALKLYSLDVVNTHRELLSQRNYILKLCKIFVTELRKVTFSLKFSCAKSLIYSRKNLWHKFVRYSKQLSAKRIRAQFLSLEMVKYFSVCAEKLKLFYFNRFKTLPYFQNMMKFSEIYVRKRTLTVNLHNIQRKTTLSARINHLKNLCLYHHQSFLKKKAWRYFRTLCLKNKKKRMDIKLKLAKVVRKYAKGSSKTVVIFKPLLYPCLVLNRFKILARGFRLLQLFCKRCRRIKRNCSSILRVKTLCSMHVRFSLILKKVHLLRFLCRIRQLKRVTLHLASKRDNIIISPIRRYWESFRKYTERTKILAVRFNNPIKFSQKMLLVVRSAWIRYKQYSIFRREQCHINYVSYHHWKMRCLISSIGKLKEHCYSSNLNVNKERCLKLTWKWLILVKKYFARFKFRCLKLKTLSDSHYLARQSHISSRIFRIFPCQFFKMIHRVQAGKISMLKAKSHFVTTFCVKFFNKWRNYIYCKHDLTLKECRIFNLVSKRQQSYHFGPKSTIGRGKHIVRKVLAVHGWKAWNQFNIIRTIRRRNCRKIMRDLYLKRCRSTFDFFLQKIQSMLMNKKRIKYFQQYVGMPRKLMSAIKMLLMFVKRSKDQDYQRHISKNHFIVSKLQSYLLIWWKLTMFAKHMNHLRERLICKRYLQKFLKHNLKKLNQQDKIKDASGFCDKFRSKKTFMKWRTINFNQKIRKQLLILCRKKCFFTRFKRYLIKRKQKLTRKKYLRSLYLLSPLIQKSLREYLNKLKVFVGRKQNMQNSVTLSKYLLTMVLLRRAFRFFIKDAFSYKQQQRDFPNSSFGVLIIFRKASQFHKMYLLRKLIHSWKKRFSIHLRCVILEKKCSMWYSFNIRWMIYHNIILSQHVVAARAVSYYQNSKQIECFNRLRSFLHRTLILKHIMMKVSQNYINSSNILTSMRCNRRTSNQMARFALNCSCFHHSMNNWINHLKLVKVQTFNGFRGMQHYIDTLRIWAYHKWVEKVKVKKSSSDMLNTYCSLYWLKALSSVFKLWIGNLRRKYSQNNLSNDSQKFFISKSFKKWRDRRNIANILNPENFYPVLKLKNALMKWKSKFNNRKSDIYSSVIHRSCYVKKVLSKWMIFTTSRKTGASCAKFHHFRLMRGAIRCWKMYSALKVMIRNGINCSNRFCFAKLKSRYCMRGCLPDCSRGDNCNSNFRSNVKLKLTFLLWNYFHRVSLRAQSMRKSATNMFISKNLRVVSEKLNILRKRHNEMRKVGNIGRQWWRCKLLSLYFNVFVSILRRRKIQDSYCNSGGRFESAWLKLCRWNINKKKQKKLFILAQQYLLRKVIQMWSNRTRLHKKLKRLQVRFAARTEENIQTMWSFRKLFARTQIRKRLKLLYSKYSRFVANDCEMAFHLWLSITRSRRVRKKNMQLYEYYEKFIALKRAFRSWDLRVCQGWTIAQTKRIDYGHFLECTYRRVFRKLKLLVNRLSD